jgi:uncharacterized protein YicC (UPF0701 family)
MTGYGKSTAELPTKKISIEIRSLNSKQFDLFTRIPLIYKERRWLCETTFPDNWNEAK